MRRASGPRARRRHWLPLGIATALHTLLGGDLEAKPAPPAGQAAFAQALDLLVALGISIPAGVHSVDYERSSPYGTANFGATFTPSEPSPDNPGQGVEITLYWDQISGSFPGAETDPVFLAFILFHELGHAGQFPTGDPCSDAYSLPGHLAQWCDWIGRLAVELPEYDPRFVCELYANIAAAYNESAPVWAEEHGCGAAVQPCPQCGNC